MITSWMVEHTEGGKWWSTINAWSDRKEFAIRFPTEADARAYVDQAAVLKGHNIVSFMIDPVTRVEQMADYDPTQLREPRRVAAEDTSRAAWRSR